MVLSPEHLTAIEVAKRIGTAGFYVPESLSHSNIALQEWTISGDSPFLNRKLRDLSEFEHIIIPAIFRGNEVLIPSGEDRLEAKDRFFMVSSREDIQKVASKLESTTDNSRVVMIFGGGRVGFGLAKILEKTRNQVKLVEPDPALCKTLSEKLDRTLVIQGTCLEEEFLLESHIEKVDFFISVTEDEEKNLLAALLAKVLGASEATVLSDRQEFSGIMKHLGVDMTVSPRLITANAVMQLLDPGPLRTLIILQEKVAEVLQVEIGPNAKIVGVPLAQAKLPREMIVAAIVRKGEVLVPRGNLGMCIGDTALLFTKTVHLEEVEKIFT